MENKSINSRNGDVRQQLNFLDDSYENDPSKNASDPAMHDAGSVVSCQRSDNAVGKVYAGTMYDRKQSVTGINASRTLIEKNVRHINTAQVSNKF